MKTPSKSRRYEYDRLTAEQFNDALKGLNIPWRYFARITGHNIRRVEEWTKGQSDIPHSVTLNLALLTLPGALDMAEAVTNARIHVYGEEEDKDA
jgi:hypothetical protein